MQEPVKTVRHQPFTSAALASTPDDGAVIDWLLAGDPAIAWQTRRDLLDQPAEVYELNARWSPQQDGGDASWITKTPMAPGVAACTARNGSRPPTHCSCSGDADSSQPMNRLGAVWS